MHNVTRRNYSKTSSNRKSNDELQLGKYTFEVNKKATKVQIAKAVEKLFEVKVLNVNTMIVKGKTKRVRYQEGKTPDWKKLLLQ